MIVCPKCSHQNTDAAQFCAHCHQTLIYRCPKCWHEQRAGGKCEKCGEDMIMYWTRQMALARAAEIKERFENDPAMKPDPATLSIESVKDLTQAVPLEPVPLLKFIAMFLLRFIGLPTFPRSS
jgi:hypothetical protein